MFTGIIEATGEIKKTDKNDGTKFTIASPFAKDLKVGDSVACDGVCLTVIKKDTKSFNVFASKETTEITNLKEKKEGSLINMERAMLTGARLDGHMVYGHVDCTVKTKKIEQGKESWIFTFDLPKKDAKYLVQKGSISINGISLTVYNKLKSGFQVMIIPHTFEVTNFRTLAEGDLVNLEYDVIAKYVENFMSARK